MAILQQILGTFPGLGHYAYGELSADAADGAFSACPFDTAIVVGSSISLTTSGANIGRFNLLVAGTYILIGSTSVLFSATNDSRFTNWRRNSGTASGFGALIGASNANTGVRQVESGLSVTVVTETVGTSYFSIIHGSGTIGSFKAGYPWAFCARIA